MSDTNLTASEVCAAAGCVASTLRAWRNRNGLFSYKSDSQGWTRFDLSEAVGVRVVAELTSRGFAAQEAVDFVNAATDLLRKSVSGTVRFVGVGRAAGSKEIEFRELSPDDRVSSELDWFDDPVLVVLNLHAIAWAVVFAVRTARGLPVDGIEGNIRGASIEREG